MSALSDVIKRMSVEANEAENNDKLFTGTVTACKTATPPDEEGNYQVTLTPLQIQLSDKIILKDGDSFLKMTSTMRSNVNSNTLPLYFNVGDKVLVMRIDKGKGYLLLDKVG